MDILTDVLETFLKKICDKVVKAINDEEKGVSSGFPVSMLFSHFEPSFCNKFILECNRKGTYRNGNGWSEGSK